MSTSSIATERLLDGHVNIAQRNRTSDNSLRGLRGKTHVADSTATGWGNSAPLALAAFAISAFMLSMVNANLVNSSVKEYVYAVALVYGGVTQFIAGLIQLRLGNTFGGVLFTSFGAFWASLFVIAEFFESSVPPAHQGQALGLFLFAFGFFAVYMLLASFRTNIVTVAALLALNVTLFLLGAGSFGGTSWLIHGGGYTGLALAALAIYLSASGVCQAAYGRDVLPVGDLS